MITVGYIDSMKYDYRCFMDGQCPDGWRSFLDMQYNSRHVPVPLYEVVQVENESLYIDMLIGDVDEYGEHAWLCVFAAHSWSGEGGFVDQYYD